MAGSISPMNESHNTMAISRQSMEYTKVTTHCTKKHRHTPNCPHTTRTQPASVDGKGLLADIKI